MSRSVRGPDYGLRIYPKHPAADAYKVGGAYEPYAVVGVDKRFTDAELAAERWMQYWGQIPFMKNGKANVRGKSERQQIINRFATLPHFDE